MVSNSFMWRKLIKWLIIEVRLWKQIWTLSLPGLCKICQENEEVNADGKLKPFGPLKQVRSLLFCQISCATRCHAIWSEFGALGGCWAKRLRFTQTPRVRISSWEKISEPIKALKTAYLKIGRHLNYSLGSNLAFPHKTLKWDDNGRNNLMASTILYRL